MLMLRQRLSEKYPLNFRHFSARSQDPRCPNAYSSCVLTSHGDYHRNQWRLDMNTTNSNTKSGKSALLRPLAIALVGSFLVALPASAVLAHTPADEEIAQTSPDEQVSAYKAKRLVRSYLCSVGFCSRFGPGAAKVRSITRDSGTWIIDARVSNSSAVMNKQVILYVDAQSGVVSDVAPASSPTQVAAE